MSMLNPTDKAQLETWLCQGRLAFNLLYSASRDGCCSTAFHEKCNNKGPTICVAYTSQGNAFGGYTSVPWRSTKDSQVDSTSFLFRLRSKKKPSYVRLPSQNAHIYDHTSYGPIFGHPKNYELQMFTGSIYKTDGAYQLNTNIGPFGYEAYKWDTENGESFTGNCTTYIDVEVYNIQAKILLPEGSPWRSISFGWRAEALMKLRGEVSLYKPPPCLKVPRVNVLLVGQVGSGKSSFINTVNSVFKGHVTSRATAGSTEHSLTTMYRMYDIRDHSGFVDKLGFRLCDTMGLEDTQHIDTLGFPYLLDGYVPDRYQFNISVPFTPHSDGFRASPTLADRCHVVVLVIDGKSSSLMTPAMLDKVRTLRLHTNHRHVPLVILFTKIDCLDIQVERDLSKVYHSTGIQEDMRALSDKVGVPMSHIMPVKNYHEETELITALDVMTMSAIRQILRLADDYFEEQMDSQGVDNKLNNKVKVTQNIL